jgi:hypothetical protein
MHSSSAPPSSPRASAYSRLGPPLLHAAEQHLLHRPEGVLVDGTAGGLGTDLGGAGIERVIEEDEAGLSGLHVFLEDLRQGQGGDHTAVGALVIGVLVDDHGRVFRPHGDPNVFTDQLALGEHGGKRRRRLGGIGYRSPVLVHGDVSDQRHPGDENRAKQGVELSL